MIDWLTTKAVFTLMISSDIKSLVTWHGQILGRIAYGKCSIILFARLPFAKIRTMSWPNLRDISPKYKYSLDQTQDLSGEREGSKGPESEGAWERGSVGAWERGSVGAWERGSVGAWERGSVGAWERGSEGA